MAALYMNHLGQSVLNVGACGNIFDIGRALCDAKRMRYDSREVLIDWATTRFVGVSVLTTVTALQMRIGTFGNNVYVNAPSKGCDVDGYISRMDYFSNIGIDHPDFFVRHDAGQRFIPITRFDKEANRSILPDKMNEAIVAHVPVQAALKSGINFAFGEAFDNVCVHSRSVVGGFAAAQYYPKKQILELCIADGGCGIPESLRRNAEYAMLNDDELLCRSLEFGVGENTTGIYDDHGFGCGKGLACIANIVKKSCGSMEIVSGNAALKVDWSGVHTIEGCCFPGTAIGIVFSTDGSHEISEEDLFVGMENSTLLKDLVEDYRSVDGIDENGSALLW